MSDNTLPPSASVPRPEVKRRRLSVSLIWLVPIIAAIIGASMAFHDWMNIGPKITVSFLTAEGLEANKTQVKYKNVVIGMVTEISLSDDRTHVLANIELNTSASPFTRIDSQYWVVRPRIGAHGVSGSIPCCQALSLAQTQAARTKPRPASPAWKHRHR